MRPKETSYAAVVYMLTALQCFFVVTVTIMGLYTLARSLAGKIGERRRVTFDNTRLLAYYTAVQGVAALLVVHLSPRLLD